MCVTYLLFVASQCYYISVLHSLLKKSKSQLGSKNSYHISVLLTLSSSFKISESLIKIIESVDKPKLIVELPKTSDMPR